MIVDVPLAHLDRTFDYLRARVAARERRAGHPGQGAVRRAGRRRVRRRAGRAQRPRGRLAPLRRSVSAERVLSPEVARLVGRVAARYAGIRSDVLRLAIPSRHATTESATPTRRRRRR